MSKLWYPVINQSKCIGCMACYDMCKHGVFTIENDKPKVIYREGCRGGGGVGGGKVVTGGVAGGGQSVSAGGNRLFRRFQERHQMRLQLRRKGRLTG
jgi:NAD-dependent dihydropyrimidine dehydrogenase PreA subunit